MSTPITITQAANTEVMNVTHTPLRRAGLVKYMECQKNHAIGIGRLAIDGCGEFMAGGEEGTLEALQCAACNCHRNFHRKIQLHQPNSEFYSSTGVMFTDKEGALTEHQPNSQPLPLVGVMITEREGALTDHQPNSQLLPPVGVMITEREGALIEHQPNSQLLPPVGVMITEREGALTEHQPNYQLLPPVGVMITEREGALTEHQPNSQLLPPVGVMITEREGALKEEGGEVKKRFRTKFTAEQKQKMREFAEKSEWKIQKVEESEVICFCKEIGVAWKVLKVWMHNNKHKFAKKNTASASNGNNH